MKNFSQLTKNLKKDFSKFKRIKVALLGDTATQFLAKALRGMGYEFGLDLDIWEADYNQIDRQIYDPTSDLYEFSPEIIIVFQSSHKLLAKYNKLSRDEQANLASTSLEAIKNYHSCLSNILNSQIIYFNYNEIDDAIYGSLSNKIEASFVFQLRKLNYELMKFAVQHTNCFLCDISSLQNQIGMNAIFHPSVYINTDMVISIDALPQIASKTVDIISALNGRMKKCIIVDLDNTMWGGVIGDDGLENIQLGSLGIGKAFTEFQYWLKKLKDRGIIIAICSKNTESIAKEPFEKHPDMVLRLEDIAIFIANWENKADNIRKIQSVLNINYDSMIFLDDNPFERNIVRENIPQIYVPELPEDPAEYLPFLYSLNLFETASISKEDAERTRLYQIETERNSFQQNCANENEFLINLNMSSIIEPFNKFNIPRVAQLSQRSNQFNLRTIRYSEDAITRIASSKEHINFAFSLMDKYGDYGLISVVILRIINERELFIDTWFMSCRVLKRTMEQLVLNTMVMFANDQNFTNLIGEYIPTSKNSLVQNHYSNLGFIEQNNRWMLSVGDYIPMRCHIQTIGKDEYYGKV